MTIVNKHKVFAAYSSLWEGNMHFVSPTGSVKSFGCFGHAFVYLFENKKNHSPTRLNL